MKREGFADVAPAGSPSSVGSVLAELVQKDERVMKVMVALDQNFRDAKEQNETAVSDRFQHLLLDHDLGSSFILTDCPGVTRLPAPVSGGITSVKNSSCRPAPVFGGTVTEICLLPFLSRAPYFSFRTLTGAPHVARSKSHAFQLLSGLR